MKRKVLSATLAVVSCIGLIGALWTLATPTDETPQAAQVCQEPQERPLTVEQRIEQLPEDGNNYTAALFVHRDWASQPEESALVARWTEYPEKLGVKSPTQLFVYDEDDAIYKERFAEQCPQLPAVMVQRSDGYVVFKDYGSHLVQNQSERTRWRLSRRPVALPWNAECNCKPKPNVTPTPKVDVVVNVPDRVTPKEPVAKKDDGFYAVLIVLCGVSGLVTAAFLFFKQVNESPTV
jgi:hypothetical protein